MLSSRSIWRGADAQLRQPIRARSFETKVSQDDVRSGVEELSHYLVLGAAHRTVRFSRTDSFFHEEKSINTNLLWLVDCCSCVPKSFLRCRNYLLRFPGFLSRVCGITRFRACPSHPGLPSGIPDCRLAFWFRRGLAD